MLTKEFSDSFLCTDDVIGTDSLTESAEVRVKHQNPQPFDLVFGEGAVQKLRNQNFWNEVHTLLHVVCFFTRKKGLNQ